MIGSLRKHLGVGRRSRRSVIVVAWLCFLIAAMPCFSVAAGSCCPDGADTKEAAQHNAVTEHAPCASRGHDGAAKTSDTEPAPAEHEGGCLTQGADPCCDLALPTLEDRSPKTPAKLADLGAELPFHVADLATAPLRRGVPPATGPPTGPWPSCPLRTAFCTYLI